MNIPEDKIKQEVTEYLKEIYTDITDFQCEISPDGCEFKIRSNGQLTGHDILPEYVEHIEKITNSTYKGTTIISGTYQIEYTLKNQNNPKKEVRTKWHSTKT